MTDAELLALADECAPEFQDQAPTIVRDLIQSRRKLQERVDKLRAGFTPYRDIDYGGEWVSAARYSSEVYCIDEDKPWKAAEKALADDDALAKE